MLGNSGVAKKSSSQFWSSASLLKEAPRRLLEREQKTVFSIQHSQFHAKKQILTPAGFDPVAICA
jgi:hypothetical protein